MKKFLTVWFALMLVFAVAASGMGESLFVDNRETDKIYPERLNLRAEPSKSGAILGLYYTGAQVNVLNVENDEYVRVEIGGMNGYMASEYLITAEEAVARYGEDSGFGDCRAAEVDLSGLWMQSVALHAQTDLESETVATLENGAQVSLVGIRRWPPLKTARRCPWWAFSMTGPTSPRARRGRRSMAICPWMC